MSQTAAGSSKVAAASTLINAGNLSGAERLLKEALAADPEQSRANALMALLLVHRGRPSEAVQQADVAIGLDPSAEAFRYKAMALIKLKRWRRAIEAAEEAVRVGPANGWNLFTLAVALENAKRPAQAKAAFARAVELDPGSPVFRGNLGLFLLRRRDVGGAERLAAELDINADADAALLLRGNLALVHHQPNEARDFALWVLSRNAANEAALRLLTQVKASQNLVLGLWWRYSLFMATKSRWIRFAIIIPLIYLTIGIITAGLKWIWMLFFLYLIACKLIFARMVDGELRTLRFSKTF